MSDTVVHLIDQQRHTDIQRATASSRHVHALSLVARLWDGDAGFVIRVHPPTIRRMRFADVDGEKLNLVTVAPLQFFQGPKLGPVRPSREAAEYEYHGLGRESFRQLDRLFPIDRFQREVRSWII